jgi:hypothetical protein
MASSSDEDINPSDFLIHSLVEGAEAEQIAGQVVADVQDVVPEGGRHVLEDIEGHDVSSEGQQPLTTESESRGARLLLFAAEVVQGQNGALQQPGQDVVAQRQETEGADFPAEERVVAEELPNEAEAVGEELPNEAEAVGEDAGLEEGEVANEANEAEAVAEDAGLEGEGEKPDSSISSLSNSPPAKFRKGKWNKF